MCRIVDLEKRQIELTVASEIELHMIAGKISNMTVPGDVILLDGPLAAGKTSFVQGFCRALGVQETVTSPTYVIANLYDSAPIKIVHIDAYRLKSAEDFYSLGVDQEMEGAVTLIEWGSLVIPCLDKFLKIEISIDDRDEFSRKVTLTRSGPILFQKIFNELERS